MLKTQGHHNQFLKRLKAELLEEGRESDAMLTRQIMRLGLRRLRPVAATSCASPSSSAAAAFSSLSSSFAASLASPFTSPTSSTSATRGLSTAAPSDSVRVFLDNLPLSVSEKEIEAVLGELGAPPVRTRVLKSKEGSLHGRALLQVADEKAVQTIIDAAGRCVQRL